MPVTNPERPGGEILPVECVTALFTKVDDLPRASQALRAANFRDSEIEVFLGEEGVRKLHVDHKQDSGLTKFLHALTEALADDATYLDSAQVVLKNGGAMVSVRTGDEEAAVHRAANALKSAGGGEVRHWGMWRTEQF